MTILSSLLTPEPGTLTPVTDVLNALRKVVPPKARLKRVDVLAMLSQDSHKLQCLNGRLYVSGVKLV